MSTPPPLVLVRFVPLPHQTYEAIGDVVGTSTARKLVYAAAVNRKQLYSDGFFTCARLAEPHESTEEVGLCTRRVGDNRTSDTTEAPGDDNKSCILAINSIS